MLSNVQCGIVYPKYHSDNSHNFATGCWTKYTKWIAFAAWIVGCSDPRTENSCNSQLVATNESTLFARCPGRSLHPQLPHSAQQLNNWATLIKSRWHLIPLREYLYNATNVPYEYTLYTDKINVLKSRFYYVLDLSKFQIKPNSYSKYKCYCIVLISYATAVYLSFDLSSFFARNTKTRHSIF